MPSFFNASNLYSYTTNSLGYIGNRLFDGGRFLFKKTGLAKVDQFFEDHGVYAHPIPYTLLGGFLLVELEESLTGNEDIDHGLSNPLVPLGMSLAAFSALINAGAMLYYRRKSSNERPIPLVLADDHHGHCHEDHGHSHDHDNHSENSSDLGEEVSEGQRFIKRCEEFASHTVGLTFYNFLLGFGSAVTFILPDEEEPDTQQALAGTVIISVFMAYLLAKCELALHESNLNEAEDDHNQSILSALYARLVTDVNEAETFPKKLLAAWVPVGILGSHALAGVFGVNRALFALELLLGEDQKIPEAISFLLYLTIPCGAISHSVSEIQAFKNLGFGLTRLKKTYITLDLKYKALFIAVSFGASCSILFHVIPEAVAFPMLIEMLTGKDLDQTSKTSLTCASAIVFGGPDLITTASATMVPALTKLFENKTNETELLKDQLVINNGGDMTIHYGSSA